MTSTKQKLLTVAGIAKLRGHRKRREVWDRDGLVLIVQPTGAKSWAWRFRNVDGKPARLNIGAYSPAGIDGLPEIGQPHTLVQARQQVLELIRRRDAGEDVITSNKVKKRKTATKVTEAAAASFFAGARLYIERSRSRSVKRGKDKSRGWRATALTLGLRYAGDSGPYAGDVPEVIDGSIVARWRDRPVAEISKAELAVLIDESTEKGVPGRAPRMKGPSESRGREVYDAVVPLFGFLTKKDWLTADPASSLEKPATSIIRKRTLNADVKTRGGDEVRIFWEATAALNPAFRDAYRLLLLLGQRRSEIAEARFTEFTDDFSIWTIPPDRTKNGEQHVVPLPKVARDILKARRKATNSEFVFSTTGSTPISGWSKTKIALDAKIAELNGGEPLDGWRNHDLRKSAATGMGQLGIAPHVVEAVLNHISGTKGGITGTRYNFAGYEQEKSVALARWSQHVLALASGKAAKNVVAFAR